MPRNVTTVVFRRVCWLPVGGMLLHLSCAEPAGPAPAAGYSTEQIDYEAPRFPGAPVVTLPEIQLAEARDQPVSLVLPEHLTVDMPVAYEGSLVHPLEQVVGALVKIGYMPPASHRTPGRPQAVVQEFAKGSDGRLTYRLAGKAPRVAGVYLLRVSVRMPPPEFDPESETRPEMMEIVAAEGEVTVVAP